MLTGRRNIKTYTVIPHPEPYEFDPLASINLVPNPYLAHSAYATDQHPNLVKITNLPAQCTVTIYTLGGGFVRRFNRNEVPAETGQFLPDIEWDLQNQWGKKGGFRRVPCPRESAGCGRGDIEMVRHAEGRLAVASEISKISEICPDRKFHLFIPLPTFADQMARTFSPNGGENVLAF